MNSEINHRIYLFNLKERLFISKISSIHGSIIYNPIDELFMYVLLKLGAVDDVSLSYINEF